MEKIPNSDITSFYVHRVDRRVVDLREAGIPECAVLGQACSRHAYPPLQEHRHFNVAEIAFIETGHQPYAIKDQKFTLLGGEGTIIPPDTPHSSDGQPCYPCKKIWLQLLLPDAPKYKQWLGLNFKEAQTLMEMLRNPANLYAKWPATIPNQMNNLFNLFDRAPTPARTAMLRVAVLKILFDLLDLNIPEIAPAHQIRVRKVIAWLETQTAKPPNVESLAQQAGLSLSSFKRVFKIVTGQAPHAYILRKRISMAMNMLCEGHNSITDIALECGFQSSQYFATVFKRITGVTPNEILHKHGIPMPADTDGQ